MSQPQVNRTRQSGPEAKKTGKDALHEFLPGGKPGGPIYDPAMGYENPGATPNLRGVEENTNRDKGPANPEQHGTPGHIGGADHDPGTGQSGDARGAGINAPGPSGRTGEHSSKLAPPPPDPRGVRK